ncbi:MAG TPA: hypothetical protein PLL10_09710 [Elusimicrobiales bacterium]|nr:hypothetical protein [Elusimicrobiales bacterium]
MMPSTKIAKVMFKTIASTVAMVFLWNQIAWAGDLHNLILGMQRNKQLAMFAPSYLSSQENNQTSVVEQKQDIENSSMSFTANINNQAKANDNTGSLTLQNKHGGSAPNSKTLMAAVGAGEGGDGTYLPPMEIPSSDSPVLSITTESGDTIYYKNNAIDYIVRQDGAIIRGLKIDSGARNAIELEGGNLYNAEIENADHSIIIIEEGKTKTLTQPDGVVYTYYITGADEGLISTAYYSASD